MQTKKRARPVTFGKETVKKETVVKTEELEEKKELAEKPEKKHVVKEPQTHEEEEDKDEVIELTPVKEDMDTVQEIKQQIEEKIHPKEDEEEEPEDVHLTAEEVSDSDEVQEDKEAERKAAFGSFTNDYDAKSRKKGSNIGFFLGVLIIAFFVGLVVIEGFYFFTTNKKLSPPDIPLIAQMHPSPTPTAAPSPTEKPLDLSAYSIKVLNGSGTTGQAAKVKDMLTETKFNVANVGNADADDYTKTIITAKKSVDKAYLKALTKQLSTVYIVDDKVASLSDTNDDDVIVTIGSSQNESN